MQFQKKKIKGGGLQKGLLLLKQFSCDFETYKIFDAPGDITITLPTLSLEY